MQLFLFSEQITLDFGMKRKIKLFSLLHKVTIRWRLKNFEIEKQFSKSCSREVDVSGAVNFKLIFLKPKFVIITYNYV